jgi:hypothetical protein
MKIYEVDWIDREEDELRLLLPEGRYEIGDYPNTISTGKEGVITYITLCKNGLKHIIERSVRKDSGNSDKNKSKGFIL